MDLALYGRVFWRFKWIVLLGLIAAISLAVLSTAKVSFASGSPSIEYRRPAQYGSHTTLLVTQAGFPTGRSNLDDIYRVPGTGDGATSPTYLPRFADPNRFSSLAVLYSTYATSDAVRQLMIEQGGPITGRITASPLIQSTSGSVQPIIDIQGVAPSPALAIKLAQRTSTALQTYLDNQQTKSKIPVTKRALLLTINAPQKTVVVEPHSKTRPGFIFITVMMAALGLCFVLENLRPRVAVVPDGVGAVQTRTVHASKSA